MSTRVQPARGMRDFLPKDKAKREAVMRIIRDTYRAHGFAEIETPIIEDINRLMKSEGGENLSLIFPIMKRGLDQGEAVLPRDAMDIGLRYDLTLPLARYYATNEAELPKVFRAMQLGPVFRAERPQKGRFRQFTQCDVDIIADETNRAEIELMTASAATLYALGIKDIVVRINDRRILGSMLTACGFTDDQHPRALILIDKLDKIGVDGVVR